MTTMVELTANGESQLFDAEHAQALLAYQNRMGLSDWALTDKNFTFNDGVLTKSANNRPDKSPKKQGADSESVEASE